MSVRLPERIGPSRAKELMFTSRRITGAAAAAIGLVDRACPEGDLDDVVSALAREIAENSPGTNRIDKALVRDASRMGREEALLQEREMPYGMPEDMGERMRAGSKKPQAKRDPSS
jgi:enoyl-CoA hydratase/carnithine racemase